MAAAFADSDFIASAAVRAESRFSSTQSFAMAAVFHVNKENIPSLFDRDQISERIFSGAMFFSIVSQQKLLSVVFSIIFSRLFSLIKVLATIKSRKCLKPNRFSRQPDIPSSR